MCPGCIATAAWIAAGMTSAGGISALVVNRLRGKKHGAETMKKEKDMETSKVVGTPNAVSSEDWEAARLELLVKEKELTRARDALAAS